MERELGHELPVRIELNKRIPIAAGLGGGSSDAAAALAGLRELFAPDLPDERLRLSAAGLGADVPFFLAGGTAVGEGIGDRLTQVRLAHSKSIFLVNPGFPVETARVYREFSKSLTRRRTGAILTELKVGRRDPETLLENDLQGACERLYPAVTALIGRCEAECGAKALMSGSGPTVFCFLNRADADEALHAFRDMAAFVAEPISTGVTAH
jgi:4-diphosphocytidyl-2-C-methyl-D-erythritol kinase